MDPASVTTSRQNRHDDGTTSRRTPVVTVTEEVNGVTLQLPEDGHVGFPTAMSSDASDPEFYLRKSRRLPVRAPACPPSARPPIVRPRPPVRPPVCPSARPPVRPSAHSLIPSAPSASYHPWSLAYKFLAVEAERALCLSVSQDCGFSLEDPLRETPLHRRAPNIGAGGMVLFWTTMWFLYLVGSASRACPLCHSVSQDCGFSLEDPLHEIHCIGGHSTLVSVRYCFADCSAIQDRLLNKATLGFWYFAPFTFVGSCLKQCHIGNDA